ncbi:MAG: PTS fructose transporter subunit IIC [Clostridium sp.]|uniref:PTS fructose transporter subunit IIC n=1 Tax=Clostridium sp. TaxID=1506 RepID=UPI002907F7E1|nr:PTS fructose transporter subunit IIC [Clostridium sp.]MDU4425942.1 PTS fructose transporter subunit IIC [Clostridium sp.]MDU7460415.1 PTS fructose transporter subunit IIC [Clostridium sp.]
MSKSTLKEKWGVMQSHLMTGISYMITVVVGAGMLMGIGGIAGQILNVEIWSPEALNSSDALVSTFAWITQVAGKGLMNLMYPIFAAFLAYAIGDKLALAPGFLGGVLASEMGSGFVGSILIGLVAGYFVKFANENIKIKRKYIGIKTMFIIPVLGVIIVSLASKFIVGPIGVGFINGITAIINAVGQAGGAALSALLGGAMAFDLGGPVNKTAMTIGMQLTSDTGFTYTPVLLGILIPPIGIGLATIIDKLLVGRKVFDDGLGGSGLPSMILGVVGISEGAIPFMISDPLGQIPINVIGASIGASISFAMGSFAHIGVPASIWGWPLIERPAGFFLDLLAGVIFVAVASVFRRLSIVKKEEKAQVK